MSKSLDELLGIMTRLRDPDGGCPWDLKQDFTTIAKHTLEEAYEVVDAIERQAWDELKGELGDLLFQVVFYAQMAKERGWYDFEAIASDIAAKMIKRHPHIFGDGTGIETPIIETPEDQIAAWENQKAAERAEKGPQSVLDGITGALPALLRAQKLQERAARVGFEWTEMPPMLEKLDEEIAELKAEISEDAPLDRIEGEMGDVLFMVVNLARRLKIDPERAVRRANAKFTRRFQAIEAELAKRGQAFADVSLDAMEAIWQAAKKLEKAG